VPRSSGKLSRCDQELLFSKNKRFLDLNWHLGKLAGAAISLLGDLISRMQS
jgi:hypothetical protein